MPDPRLATLRARDYGRIYTHPVTREEHVSSTTVLKMWPKQLDRWAAGEAAGEAWDQRQWLLGVTREQAVDALKGAAERSRNKAGTHGRLVHTGCELLAMRAAGWELTPEQNAELYPLILGHQGASVQQALNRFAEWADKYVAEWMFLEQTVWGNGWAGTFDAIVRQRDGRVTLVDYKTGKGIFQDIKLQFASYAYAPIILNAEGVETAMPDIQVCAYLHLPQVGGYAFRDLEVTEADLETFERLLENWHWSENTPRNPGVAIPIATAPWVPGVRECGAARPSPQTGRAGSVACVLPQGHDGDHHGKSKTGSRKYFWRDEDVPGASDDAAGLSPRDTSLAPQERPVLNVLEGGAGTDSSDTHSVAPLQGSSVRGSGDSWTEATAPPYPTVPTAPAPSGEASVPVPGPEGSGGSSPVPAPSPDYMDTVPYADVPVGQLTDGQVEEQRRALLAAGALPKPDLDQAEAYSAKIAALFTKPGGEG